MHMGKPYHMLLWLVYVVQYTVSAAQVESVEDHVQSTLKSADYTIFVQSRTFIAVKAWIERDIIATSNYLSLHFNIFILEIKIKFVKLLQVNHF